MSEENLLGLQQQIENLIIAHSRLVAENNQLHNKLELMAQKNMLLQNKKDDAYKKLQNILTQIKEGAL
jgi:hypothetical protein